MIWLNASLAFALAMIIFCTMVTAITEAVHHFFNMRQSGLERMLAQLFKKVIWPRVGPMLASIDADPAKKALQATPISAPPGNSKVGLSDRLRTLFSAPKVAAVGRNALLAEFLDTLTSNPAIEQHDGRFLSLRTWFAPRQLDSLTLAQFAERFADTELGKQLWSSGRERAIQVVDDIARRFERFEDGATAYFAQRAQMISLLVAILLAFALNIDAIRLFTAFLTDQQLTARVLAESQSITDAFKKQQAEVAPPKAPTAVAQGAVPENKSATAPEGPSPTPSTIPASTAGTPTSPPVAPGADDSADYQALREKMALLNKQMAVSTALGLPIGAAYYPWCLDEPTQPTCKERLTLASLHWGAISFGSSGRFARWFVSVLLAGVLIGLGGPFWFNAFSSLSAFVRLLGGPDKQNTPTSKDTAAADEKSSVKVPPKTAGETFAAAAGGAAPQLAPGRLLLTPRGTPL